MNSPRATADDLDVVLGALANAHRRAIVHALGLQPYSISQLAGLRELSLPAIHKHLAILEDAQLIRRRKTGRTTYLTLQRQTLRSLQDWLAGFHTHWGTHAESLTNYETFLTGNPSGTAPNTSIHHEESS
ncbi:MAG: ArsR/SmtB family transcription factor [Propionibacteriaceae bacterium]